MTQPRPVDPTLVSDVALVAASGAALAVVLALVFAGTGRTSVSASSDRPAIGKLKRQMNRVRRRVKGDLVWNAIGRGAPIYGDDAVYVGPDSEATIELDDGSRIEIDESSMVVISRQADSEDTEEVAVAVSIVRGGAMGRSGRGRLALHAGKSTARLGGGSAARVRLRGDRTASVAVRAGAAEVEAETGEAVTVREGERRRLDETGHSVGEGETVAIELLSPAPGARVHLTPAGREVSFAWQPRPGPGTYLLEIANDPDFQELAARVPAHLPRAEARLPSQGVFYWRVVRSEKGGRKASEERRLIAVEEVAPVPYRPVADSVVDLSDGRPLSFAWGAVPGAGRYILEVAQGESFKTPLYSLPVDRPSHIVRPSESQVREGRHCFRVRASAPGRGPSPWSETTCFRIITSPVLRAPRLYPPSTDGNGHGQTDDGGGGQRGSLLWRLLLPPARAAAPSIPPVRLRWERLSGAAAYLIEIATDEAFANTVVRQRVQTNSFRWQPPARRPYYWRVRGVDAEGRPGRVSETREVEVELRGPPAATPATGARFQHTSRPPRVRLEWAAVRNAVGYAVEIGRDAAFAGAVDSLDTATTSVAYVPPALGAFFWRVSGLFEGGRKTLPGASASFVVVSAPPQPLEPRSGARVPMTGPQTAVQLRWTRRPVRRFDLVVATDRELTDVVSRSVAAKSTATIAVAEPVELYWRVRAVEPRTGWSNRGSFSVVPATPVLTGPGDRATLVRQGASPTVELFWAAAPGAKSYRVSLQRPAAGGQGSQPEPESISVPGTTTTLELRTPGIYTWSVSAVFDASLVSDASLQRSFSLQLDTIEPTGASECAAGRCEGGNCVDSSCVEADERRDADPKANLRPSIHVGPRLGLFYNLGEIVTARYGVETGARVLVAGHRLGVSLTAAYFTDATAFPDSGIHVRSRLHGLPVELVAVYVVPIGPLDLASGLGMAVTTTYTWISVAGQPDLSVTHVSLGGLAVAGLEWPFGPGDLVGEVRFGVGSRSASVVETGAAAVGLEIGYRIGVW